MGDNSLRHDCVYFSYKTQPLGWSPRLLQPPVSPPLLLRGRRRASVSLNPSDSPKEIWNFFSPYTIKMKRQSYLQFLQAFLNTILSKGIKCTSPAKEVARYSLCGAAADTTAMPWGAIPEVPGGGCPERGIGCPMVPRPPIPPRDCPGPREGMPIPAAPAVGPPVRLCSAFIGSVGTQGHRVSAECWLNRKAPPKARRPQRAHTSFHLQARLPQSPKR